MKHPAAVLFHMLYLLRNIVKINAVCNNGVFIREEFIIIHTKYQKCCEKNNENILPRKEKNL